jgi:hypothetical protein
MGNLYCPAFGEEDALATNKPLGLIPLQASYDQTNSESTTARQFASVTTSVSASNSDSPPASDAQPVSALNSLGVQPSANDGQAVVNTQPVKAVNSPSAPPFAGEDQSVVATPPANSNQPFLNPISFRRIVPIVFDSAIDSKSVCIGERIMAKLKEDLCYGRNLIAPKNSLLRGCIVSCRTSRTLSHSLVQKEDRLKSGGVVEIRFNELIIDQNKLIPLIGLPVHQESIWQGADGYTHAINVDHNGRIVGAGRTLSKGQQDTSNALRVATFAPLPGSVLVSMVAAPVVMGAVGAASPDVAFNKPIDRNVKHRRLRGMAYGFASNLPGAFFVQAVVEKGSDVILNRGDELMIDLSINGFSNYQIAGINQPNVQREVLAVKAQVVTPPVTRLVPGLTNSCGTSPGKLALKPFIPTSE